MTICFTILFLLLLLHFRVKLIYKLAQREIDIAKTKAFDLIDEGKDWKPAFENIQNINFICEVFDLTKWTHKQIFPGSSLYWTDEVD